MSTNLTIIMEKDFMKQLFAKIMQLLSFIVTVQEVE